MRLQASRYITTHYLVAYHVKWFMVRLDVVYYPIVALIEHHTVPTDQLLL